MSILHDLLELREKDRGNVLIDAVLQVEELLNTVLLVLTLGIVGLLHLGGNTSNALLKVVLERVARTLDSLLLELGHDVLGLLFLVVIVLILVLVLLVGVLRLGSILRLGGLLSSLLGLFLGLLGSLLGL